MKSQFPNERARSLSTSSAAMTQKAAEGNEIALSTVNYESHCKGQQLPTDHKNKKLVSSLPEKNHCNKAVSEVIASQLLSPSSLPPVSAEHVLFSHCAVKISSLSVKGHLD